MMAVVGSDTSFYKGREQAGLRIHADHKGSKRPALFLGSGVIEAACRTVVAKRLKQSGMFWTVKGANAVIALRRCRLNREFEDYWASRSCAA